MTIVIGDFWNTRSTHRQPGTVAPEDYADYEFSPRRADDMGAEWALRTADRMELSAALRAGFRGFYVHRVELARRDGATPDTHHYRAASDRGPLDIDEPHRLDPRLPYTRGDRVAAWLGQALLAPRGAEVPDVQVPWHWDPDEEGGV